MAQREDDSDFDFKDLIKRKQLPATQNHEQTNQCFEDAKKHLEEAYKMCFSKLLTDWETLQEQHKGYSDVLDKAHFTETVKLNVGGTVYQTSLLTLNSDPNSMLAHMFSGRYELRKSEDGEYFIDRDGECFKHVLNYLRNGEVWVINEETRFQLLIEAEFFRLDGLINLIGYGFNGSSILDMRLRKILFEETEKVVTKSVTGKWRKIYSGDRDGWSAADFHRKCDKITPTIVVIRSEHGNIFGGFTVADWSGDKTAADQKAFIFNLFSKSWKEPVFMKANASSYLHIKPSPLTGPSFGAGQTPDQLDIFISSEPQKHQSSCKQSGAFIYPNDVGYSLIKCFAGAEKYFVTAMEVFTTMEIDKEEDE